MSIDNHTWINFTQEQREYLESCNPQNVSAHAARFLAKKEEEYRTDLTWFECLFGVLDGSRDDVMYK
jgi:hypothetical protein